MKRDPGSTFGGDGVRTPRYLGLGAGGVGVLMPSTLGRDCGGSRGFGGEWTKAEPLTGDRDRRGGVMGAATSVGSDALKSGAASVSAAVAASSSVSPGADSDASKTPA